MIMTEIESEKERDDTDRNEREMMMKEIGKK